MSTSIYTSRRDFDKNSIPDVSDSDDPFNLFEIWMNQAVDKVELDPNAFCLSTVSEDHIPSSRILLLRSFDRNGFVFFTNYQGRKGKELSSNPNASMNFYWPSLELQIRINGIVETITEEESNTYFQSRPRESQIAAWISPQSKVIENRKELLDKYFDFEKENKDKKISKPPFWGGYRLMPSYFEFWQGAANRLHDRISFIKAENGIWECARLAP